MSVARTNFDNITEADLAGLIDAAVPEGLAIEYKSEPYGGKDADKKEALKDVTSFANSTGGHLIIGMEEIDGVPTALTGLPGIDADALVNRLESLVRDGVEPRMIGVRMRRVSLSSGGNAVVVRVPRSWNPPHRVSTGNSNRFYVRNSGGAHEASVEELRVLFTLAADAQNRIRDLRADRLAKIVLGQGPVPIAAGGRSIVHLVPLAAFGPAAQIELEAAYRVRQNFTPLGATGQTPRFNLDGVVNIRGGPVCHGYTQIFRNGVIEATKSEVLMDYEGQQILIGPEVAKIVDAMPAYFEGLCSLSVPPPIVVMVSFQGVQGKRLALRGYDRRLEEIEPFPMADPLMLPEVIIDDYAPAHELQRLLQPILDALWNAAGFPRCTYYDDHGDWNPPRS